MSIFCGLRISCSRRILLCTFRNTPVLKNAVLSPKLRAVESCRYASSGLHDEDEDDDSGFLNNRDTYSKSGFSRRGSASHPSSRLNRVLREEDDESGVLNNTGVYDKRGFSRRGAFDSDYASGDNAGRVNSRFNQFSSNNEYNRRNNRNQGLRGIMHERDDHYEMDRYNDNGRYPSQSGNRFGGERSRNEFSVRREFYSSGESFGNLAPANFDLNNLQPILKNLYVEHPDVTARSMENVKDFRQSVGITVKGTGVPKPIMKFDELKVSEDLMKIIHEQGFNSPTPIQSQGWPIALSGRDMVGISQTGSGKTLVFMLPAAVHMQNQASKTKKEHMYSCQPQALVLAPTRELAQQINHVGQQFHIQCGIRSSCIYGGASKNVQRREMAGSNLCVATPGRLIDFLGEGAINLSSCTYVVLDEADRMLDMGFEPQIRRIISQIRPDRQTLMWSATWPKEIRILAEDFLKDYIQVNVGSEELTANPNIKQNIHVVSETQKLQCLFSILQGILSEPDNKTLIFAQTKRTVDRLAQQLSQNGVRSHFIHGDISQAGRDRVLRSFRSAKSGVLVATDVAARGLDVDDIRFVVNFDFPQCTEDYIHRIGRTARGTNSGTAHTLFTTEQASQAKELITVLKRANQHVSEDLSKMAEMNENRNFRSNRGRYGPPRSSWNNNRRSQFAL